MKSRTRFIVLASGVAVLAFVGSSYLIPSSQDLALSSYKDKNYEQALALYQQEMKNGNLTLDTAVHLSGTHLQYAQVDEAITVMESFVAQNPTHVEALKELGRLYQYGQKPEKYLEVLEKLNQMKDASFDSETLITNYTITQNDARAVPLMLERVMNEQSNNPQEFRDLIYLLAVGKKYEKALQVHDQFFSRFPKHMTFADHETALRIYADMGKISELKAYAQRLHETKLHSSDIGRVATILLYKASPNAALEFMQPYADKALVDKELFGQYLTILMASEHRKKAYALTLGLHREGGLDLRFEDELLDLANEFGNDAIYEEVRETIAYDLLSEQELVQLLQIALVRNDPKLLAHVRPYAQQLAQQKNDSYLRALLVVADGQGGNMGVVVDTMRNEPSFARRLQLASLCSLRKMTGCVDAFMEQLPEASTLSDQELMSVVMLLQDRRRYDEAFALIDAAKTARPNASFEAVWFPLAVRSMSLDDVENYLRDAPALDANSYARAYFLAMDTKLHDKAIMLGEHMVAMEDNKQHRDYVLQAYFAGGRYEDIIEQLRTNKGDSAQAEENYLFALAKLAPRNAKFANELADYAMGVLNSSPSQERRMAMIYTMIAAKQQGRIMPYVRDLALKNPKEWAFLYADYLKGSQGSKGVTDFWLEVADRHPQDTKLQSQIAYNILEQGNHDAAIGLFEKIAAGRSPDDPLVKQLVYLWSPLYPEAGIAWLSERAEQSTEPQEKLAWLRMIANGVSDDALLELAQRHPDLLALPDVEQRYVSALKRATTPEQWQHVIHSYLQPRIDQAQTVQPLLRYAELAGQQKAHDMQELAYRKALSMSPNNPIILGKLGAYYHSRADYSKARETLTQYFANPLPSLPATAEAYRPHFVYAELFRMQRDDKQARKYYKELVAAASAADDRDVEFHSMAARSLMYGDFVNEGKAIFERMIKANPENRQLRADYSAALIEVHDRDVAEQSLASWKNPLDGADRAYEPIALSGLHASAYSLLDGDRRLVLVHRDKTDVRAMAVGSDESTSHRIAALEQQPWVAYGTEGERETMVVAKEGYRFEVTKTSNQELWLMPVRDKSVEARELDQAFAVQNELMQARLEVETGRGYAADKRSYALAQQHPHNAQVLGFAANVDNFVGNPQRARRLIQRASDLQPENEDIMALKRVIDFVHAPNVFADVESRMLGDNNEVIQTIGGSVDVTDTTQVGVVLQNNDVSSTTVRLPDGRSEKFDVERQRAELFVRHSAEDDGAESQLSFFANNDTPGVGVSHGFANEYGYSRASLEYHRPFWEFVEGIIDDATRDRAAVMHRYSPDDKYTYVGELGINSYNTEYQKNSSNTVSFNGSVIRRIYDVPYVAVGYNLDAEYETSEKNGRDAQGVPYQLFPMDSREVHSVNILANHNITPDTTAEGLLGFGIDRMSGDAGPAGEARVTHFLTDRLAVQGRAAYGFRGGPAQGDLTRVGVRLQYQY
ncbi:MAG: hypothetical protein EAY65_03545 [Alphaproteobacteria bacterium]|nr:MAG: hypothetical protein EAY65_03545 [Alphaproteobacteria bacterium]